MSITFRCRGCSHQLAVKDEHAGKTAKCPNCQGVIQIPLGNPVPERDLGLSEDSTPTRTQPSAATHLVNCKTCGKQVSKTAPTCPHCGENLPGLRLACRKCGSKIISAGQKGFGLGKAGAGLLLLGPIGLLGGMIGRKRPEFICQTCGYKWRPSAEEVS